MPIPMSISILRLEGLCPLAEFGIRVSKGREWSELRVAIDTGDADVEIDSVAFYPNVSIAAVSFFVNHGRLLPIDSRTFNRPYHLRL